MATLPQDLFTPQDLQQLRRRGLSADEARHQALQMAENHGSIELDRPCTVGDGIVAIRESELPELATLATEAAQRGRVRSFVPASGAASRMFKDLLTCKNRPGDLGPAQLEPNSGLGAAEAKALATFIRGLDKFAFRRDLEATLSAAGASLTELAAKGPFGRILSALLDSSSMDYAELPKALLAFHRYEPGPRTPFEEHLVEASHLVRDRSGRCRIHFTVSPHHLTRFEALLDQLREKLEPALGVKFEISFSMQKAATDTIAIDLENRPVREKDGSLLFRPAGHGALIENLQDQLGDLVLIKNIDNVAHERFKALTYTWTSAMLGYLVRVQTGIRTHLGALETKAAGAVDAALAFARDTLHRAAPATLPADQRGAWVRDLLDRPLRVCGMVVNTGEPGGGPFWVKHADGRVTQQIVESAQVDAARADQTEILKRSTHFNPVFLACALRTPDGLPYELRRFIDADAVIVTKKSSGGKDLKALERPGLWNGAMADWLTLFVEVPIGVFNPVKTVNDLLKAEHQPS